MIPFFPKFSCFHGSEINFYEFEEIRLNVKSSFCIISSRNNHETHGRSFWFFNEDSLDFFIGLVLFLVSEIVPVNFGSSGEDNQFAK